MNAQHPIKALADLALRSTLTDTERLAAYDSIGFIATFIAEALPVGPEQQAVRKLSIEAITTASAIREADLRQLAFQELVQGGEA